MKYELRDEIWTMNPVRDREGTQRVLVSNGMNYELWKMKKKIKHEC